MILEEVKTIILVTSNTIKAGTVTLGEAPKLGDTVENPWTQDNLKEIFLAIKRVFGNPNIRLVIDDSLCTENLEPQREFWQKLTTAASETGMLIDAYEPASKAKERHSDPMVGLALKKDVVPVESRISQSFVPQRRKFPVKFLLIGLGVLVLAATLIGAIYLYTKKDSKDSPSLVEPVASQPTPVESMPEPTPSPSLERSELKIKILNGSGVSGLAGKAKDLLEDKGYGEIATGNADSFDYEETTVQIKEEKNLFLDLLIEDLSEDYLVSTDSSDPLEEESDFDAIVTLGKE
ncbi:MAG: LytR C-terminal domain-containing protein [Patescibacteria group bacterium]|jgi:hypothetical protein